MFITVNFDVLLVMFRTDNLSPPVINIFQSYLRGRRRRIQIEGTIMTKSNEKAVVPQVGVRFAKISQAAALICMFNVNLL